MKSLVSFISTAKQGLRIENNSGFSFTSRKLIRPQFSSTLFSGFSTQSTTVTTTEGKPVAPFDLRKDKLRCTPEAFTALENAFATNKNPSNSDRNRLASELGLSRQIARKFFYYKNAEFRFLHPEEAAKEASTFEKRLKRREERADKVQRKREKKAEENRI
eukprot:TRINITY_DN8729_c0_g1_i1.p1 TRINITY_DN8729_c0_g1~~TRINITY_DN8729_c0_g1_i1.p1  ORF type:complete len:161 (-),score=35.47 TRINITY_DN8729_c0_g1_i1:38-520(-)